MSAPVEPFFQRLASTDLAPRPAAGVGEFEQLDRGTPCIIDAHLPAAVRRSTYRTDASHPEQGRFDVGHRAALDKPQAQNLCRGIVLRSLVAVGRECLMPNKPALFELHDRTAQTFQFIEIVRADQERRAFGTRDDQLAKCARVFRVDTGGRLVEQDQFGSPIKACARDIRLRMPWLSAVGRLRADPARSTTSSTRETSLRAAARAKPCSSASKPSCLSIGS